jgi:hypothetical protein
MEASSRTPPDEQTMSHGLEPAMGLAMCGGWQWLIRN